MTTGSLSKAGAAFSASHEACFLFAYPDPGTGGEPLTIGVGHTRAAGEPVVRRGDRISFQRAFEIYAADMGRVERGVRAAIKPELKQHQFDAACSFHLNTGAIGSGSIDDRLNRGDEAGALAVWGQYVNAGGKPMAGLITRRREEIALWRTGQYPARRLLIRDTPTGSGRYVDASTIPWRGDAPAPVSPPIVVEADRPAPVIVKSPVKVTVPARPVRVPAQPVRPAAATSLPWYTRFLNWLVGA